jgi:hypothetical protein
MVTLDEFRAYAQCVGRPVSPAEAHFCNDVAERIQRWIMAQTLRERQAHEAQSQPQEDDTQAQ